jgi:tetratricopeptide (TPR) repeat protein
MAEPNLENVLAGKESMNAFFGLSQDQLIAIAALGFNLYQQGQIDDARTLFDGLATLEPSLYYGHAGLGAIALAAGDAQTALGHLATAAELNPSDAAVQANLGEALLRTGEVAGGARHLGRAIELDPDARDAGANRARAILQGISSLDRHLDQLASGVQ